MKQHYIGAVYDFTVKNMNFLIAQLEHALKCKEFLLQDNERIKAELERKLEIAKSALEFYSLKSNYSIRDEGRNYRSKLVCYELNEQTYVDEELGTRARQALEALK